VCLGLPLSGHLKASLSFPEWSSDLRATSGRRGLEALEPLLAGLRRDRRETPTGDGRIQLVASASDAPASQDVFAQRRMIRELAHSTTSTKMHTIRAKSALRRTKMVAHGLLSRLA
jgi:hypothetical protein